MSKKSASGLASHSQVAALPYRIVGSGSAVHVLLVTSQSTGQWIIPKGWPMKGQKNYRTAEREAFEEAGIEGRIGKRSIGSYLYFKRRTQSFDLVRVHVYPLHVKKIRDSWPEQDKRKRAWFPLHRAADLVGDPNLGEIVVGLTPPFDRRVRKPGDGRPR